MWKPIESPSGKWWYDNYPWYKTWLKEMTYDDSALISPLNNRQLINNKKAYSNAKADRQYLCKKNNKDLNDYVIYKYLSEAVDGKAVKGIGTLKKVVGEVDTDE